MASLRTQNDGASGGYLSASERAALGGYRAGSDVPDSAHIEYHWLIRAYALPTCTAWTGPDGVRCYEFGPTDNTPHPGTPPRVIARLNELVEILAAPYAEQTNLNF